MLIPVVLSGGAGTRLWPVSREGHPKPFMRLSDGDTLLEKTYSRAIGCDEVSEVLTITNRDYYFQSKDCWSRSILDEVIPRFLLEPSGRNTAPALLLGALKILDRHGEDAIMLVLPADHLIKDMVEFSADAERASELAKQGYLVTFGVHPTQAETGFGYIRAGDAIADMQGGFKVASFIEKPPLEDAERMVAEGGHYWNAGMFCFRVSDLLSAFSDYAPEMLAAGEHCWEASHCNQQDAYCELEADSFSTLENISIDYAIMEKAENVAVVAAGFDWSDIGSWQALADLSEPDSQGNRALGEVVNVNSHNCFVQSEDRLVATLGLESIMIVDTPDALLVSHRDQAQNVREVVKKLKAEGHACYKLHRTVSRPWGAYTVLEEGRRYKIKRIEVKPGASLSLQMHHHRSEHWIVVRGAARIINGDEKMLIKANESTYIPAGHKHRLENPGVIDLIMIEVQSGEYLGEDDIVRIEDNYGRRIEDNYDLQ